MQHTLVFFRQTGQWLALSLLLCSCISYYQLQSQFNQNFEQGNMPAAESALRKDKKAESRKTKLLYFLNMGTVLSMQGRYEESNQFLEKAYLFGEDYHTNYLNVAASFLLNPNIIEYKGEDFENLLVNYYKALNYLKLGQNKEALVECRRMNIRLLKLSDKYTSEKKFQRDAFIQTLMGIIYETGGEYNDAFIAYRNAAEVYEKDYSRFFGLSAPEQLKKDLLRMAYTNGFQNDLSFWEKKFNMKFQPAKTKTGDLIFLWHNGLGPVKEQDGINFTIARGRPGFVNFTNANFGFSFTFPISDSSYHKSGLAALEFIRVVYPRYMERPAFFQSARLSSGNQIQALEKAEDINAIAFKTLEERRLQELGKALLRLALKKAEEYTLRKDNQNAGALLGIFNALTEQADTRGWQSVPHTIYYTRLSLPEGTQPVTFTMQPAQGVPQTKSLTFDIKAGRTVFHTFSSLEVNHTLYARQRF
jgi:uncharacterized protein